MKRGMNDMARKSRYIAYVMAVNKAGKKGQKDGKRRQVKAVDRPAN